MTVEALVDISSGQELTFFYPSTEWSMASPFLCGCGSPCCLKSIAGASHMDPGVVRQFRLSAHIQAMLAAASQTAQQQ